MFSGLVTATLIILAWIVIGCLTAYGLCRLITRGEK